MNKQEIPHQMPPIGNLLHEPVDALDGSQGRLILSSSLSLFLLRNYSFDYDVVFRFSCWKR